jgi:site-specific recombinase XerD
VSFEHRNSTASFREDTRRDKELSRSPVIVPGFSAGRPPANKGRRLPPEPLTEAEVGALLAQCSRRAPTGVRNRALIVLLWRAGLRISEALALKPADLDPDAGTVRVLHGKGNRSRVVGLDPLAFQIVERWVECRQRRGLGRVELLFCTLDGRPLQASYVRQLLPRLARKAGLTKRVHPHGLRHTHAVELRREGVDIAIISKQLGHRSIATTARYLDHVAPFEVVEAMRQREWTPLGPTPGRQQRRFVLRPRSA